MLTQIARPTRRQMIVVGVAAFLLIGFWQDQQPDDAAQTGSKVDTLEAASLPAAAEPPAFVREAAADAKARYQWEIWGGAECPTAEAGGSWYMLCRVPKGDGGALYRIRESPTAPGFVLLALTGKAMQHADTYPALGATSDRAITGANAADIGALMALFDAR